MRLVDSLARDARFLALAEVCLHDRLRLTYEKYAMRARAALGLPKKKAFRFAGRPYHVSAPTDAALLQRVLTDTRECLETLGLTGENDLTLVDVGAHNGETVIAWSLFLRSPTIYSFEPDPVCYRNAEMNVGDLTAALHGVGLSDHAGQAPFDDAAGAGGGATFALAGVTANEVTAAPVVRGDDVLVGVSPDLVKIDVEGYERHVFDGIDDTLARCRCLTLELSLRRPKDHRFHEIAAALAKHRFELVGAGEPHGPNAAQPSAIDLHFKKANGAG